MCDKIIIKYTASKKNEPHITCSHFEFKLSIRTSTGHAAAHTDNILCLSAKKTDLWAYIQIWTSSSGKTCETADHESSFLSQSTKRRSKQKMLVCLIIMPWQPQQITQILWKICTLTLFRHVYGSTYHF
jgi:hypothetical protein